jgi:alcohol dehydrogenase (NADP+)
LGGCHYPFVGGHELVGKVVECGQKVTKVKVGDFCGVGCMVDSCLDCTNCKASEESYCEKGLTATYNGAKQHGRVEGNQSVRTHGGYSGSLVVHEHFVIKIPNGMDLVKTAPILCAGITMV